MASEPPKESTPRPVYTRSVKRVRVKSNGDLVTYEETRVLYDNKTVGVYEDLTDAHFKKLRPSKLVRGYPPEQSGNTLSFPTRTVLPPRGAPSRYSARVAAQPTLPEVEAPPPAKVVLNLGTVIQVQSPEGVLVTKAIRTVLEMEGGREQIKEILKKPDVIAGVQLRRAMRIRRA